MTTEWVVVNDETTGRMHSFNFGPHVRAEVHFVLDNDDPKAIEAVEKAASNAGVKLQRLAQSGEFAE